ncbi:RES family NAD+ phosphorylase [Labrys okinawensis]|uniref:RES family NAD+ phosphorylase n=1 Tax=Labrys okinawensis TaxID=346911 RepID=UPI0039BC7C56
MRRQGICFRAHNPMWAWAPTSGYGAAIRGARFNPPGASALYLALTMEGMFLEMGHGFGHFFDPLTICSYTVDCEDIVDLRTDIDRSAASVDLDDMRCAWASDVASGRRPASWGVADTLMKAGATGILVPSFVMGARPDMANLVLWTYGPDLPHRVTVHDPSGVLPQDRSSWRTRSV